MQVKYLVLQNGAPLYRGSEEATGYDASTRAIVSTDFDEDIPYQRNPIYRFDKPDRGLGRRIRWNNG